jgi:hypothetical protein
MVNRFIRFQQIAGLGIMPIFGFAGSGKTEFLATVALILMACPAIKRIYCAAQAHVAISNLAEMINKIALEVHVLAGDETRKLPMVIRGYSMPTEIDAFWEVLRHGDANVADKFPNSPWNIKLSLCEWGLKVIGFAGYTLSDTDSDELHRLRRKFLADKEYHAFRLLVAGRIKLHELDIYQPQGVDTSTPYSVISGLFSEVVMCADAVCTTTYASRDLRVYEVFNVGLARATVLDEAGAMSMGSALMAWIDDGRPCVMAGDEKQLPPTVMTMGERRGDKCANMFANFLRVSILEHAKRTGFPCFVLDKQYRIVKGLFELPRRLFYGDVVNFKYADSADLSRRPKARMIELHTRSEYPSLRACPEGEILPVFFHCSGSQERFDETSKSLYNPTQNAIAVNVIKALLDSRISTASEVAVITPYRANLERLKELLQPLGVVNIYTTDSFQVTIAAFSRFA